MSFQVVALSFTLGIIFSTEIIEVDAMFTGRITYITEKNDQFDWPVMIYENAVTANVDCKSADRMKFTDALQKPLGKWALTDTSTDGRYVTRMGGCGFDSPFAKIELSFSSRWYNGTLDLNQREIQLEDVSATGKGNMEFYLNEDPSLFATSKEQSVFTNKRFNSTFVNLKVTGQKDKSLNPGDNESKKVMLVLSFDKLQKA